MLDRIVDAPGRLINYEYVTDTNYYNVKGGVVGNRAYISGGAVDTIWYGHIEDVASATSASEKVVFTYAPRCNALVSTSTPQAACGTDVSTVTAANAANFPDIPADMLCTSTGSCSKYSPTFFHRRALAYVSTYRKTSTSFSQIARVNLRYDWLDVDGTGPDPARLWLRTIDRVGTMYFGSTSTGNIRFDGPLQGPMPNRIDHGGGVSEMKYHRIGRIRDEYGSLVEVVYALIKDCDPNNNNDVTDTAGWAGWDHNTWSCFPRWWTPVSGPAGFGGWNKWSVDHVIVHDLTGRSPAMTTTYDYPATNIPGQGINATYASSMAWRYDRDRYSSSSVKSWGTYRGFAEVRVTTGTYGAADDVTTVHRFYRGMNGDRFANNTLKTVSMDTSLPTTMADTTLVDDDWFYGLEYESFVASSTAGTASQTGNTQGVITKYVRTDTEGTDPRSDWVQPSVEYGRARGQFSKTVYAYDGSDRLLSKVEYGSVDASYADIANPIGDADSRCTYFNYTQPGVWYPRGLVGRQRVFGSADCATSPLSDVRSYYDHTTGTYNGQTPTAGALTKSNLQPGGGVVDDAHAATAVETTYDYEADRWATTPGWGRLLATTDPMGTVTTVTYTPFATTALSTGDNHNVKWITTETNSTGTGPLDPTGTVVIRPTSRQVFDVWGSDVSTVDISNGSRTTYACYDALGRLSHVFAPTDTPPTTPATSSLRFYTDNCVDADSSLIAEYVPTAISSPVGPIVAGDSAQQWATKQRRKVDGTRFVVTWTLYDGMLRNVLTKAPTPSQNNAVSPVTGVSAVRTKYDESGRVVRQSEPFYSSGASQSAVFSSWADTSIPRDNVTTYNAYGEIATTELYNTGSLARSSTITRSGATITTTVASPGTSPYGPTRITIDRYGQTIRSVRDYGGIGATTDYKYNGAGKVVEIALPGLGSNPSTYTYNYLGWLISSNDNNRGVTTTQYYATGQPESTTDAEGRVTYYKIDELGRTVAAYEGHGTYTASATTGYRLQSFAYDAANAIGQVRSATSYQPAGVAAFTATASSIDPDTGRILQTTVTNFAADDTYEAGDNTLDTAINMPVTYTTDGLIATQTYPGTDGWATTTPLTITYDYGTTAGTYGLLKTVKAGTTEFIADQSYDSINRPNVTQLRQGAWGLNVDTNYSAVDGRVSQINATRVDPAAATSIGSNEVYTYDDAGMLTDAVRDVTGTADDEHECFYYDTAQRLNRGLTVDRTAACPTAPAGTTPTGGAPYHLTFGYDARNNMTSGNGQTHTLAMSVTAFNCASGTETNKPDAIASVTAGGGHPAESFRYDCNGNMISRQTSTTGTAYAWDRFGRLEATATGTTATWTNLSSTTTNSYGDLTSANTLTGTTWAAGATTTQTLTGDGAVSFRLTDANNPTMAIGLNDTNTGVGESEINYSIRRTGNTIQIFEAGTQRCAPSCNYFTDAISDSDVYTIRRTGTTITYLRNGRPFSQSTVAASGTFFVDTSFMTASATIRDVTVTSTNSGVERNVYDAAGQRVLRVDPDTTKTIYLGITDVRWDPGTPSSVQVARYYPGGTQRGFDGTVRYAVTNQQGSITALVNTATGAVTADRYKPYGELRGTSTAVNDRAFLRQVHDTNNGLIYLNNRYHDPTLGTFLSVDPLIATTGEPYIYASGNPTTLSDPLGLDPGWAQDDSPCNDNGYYHCFADGDLLTVQRGKRYYDEEERNRERRCGCSVGISPGYEVVGYRSIAELTRFGLWGFRPQVPSNVIDAGTVADGSLLAEGDAIGLLGVSNEGVGVGSDICSVVGGAAVCGRVSLASDVVGLGLDLTDVVQGCSGISRQDCSSAVASGALDFLIFVVTKNSPAAALTVSAVQLTAVLLGEAIGGLQEQVPNGWQFVAWDYERHFDSYYPAGTYSCGGQQPWTNQSGGVCVAN